MNVLLNILDVQNSLLDLQDTQVKLDLVPILASNLLGTKFWTTLLIFTLYTYELIFSPHLNLIFSPPEEFTSIYLHHLPDQSKQKQLLYCLHSYKTQEVLNQSRFLLMLIPPPLLKTNIQNANLFIEKLSLPGELRMGCFVDSFF